MNMLEIGFLGIDYLKIPKFAEKSLKPSIKRYGNKVYLKIKAGRG